MTQFDTQRMLIFTYSTIQWNRQSAFVELGLHSKAFTICSVIYSIRNCSNFK